MATVAVSVVRARFDAALTGGGWVRSRFAPELFGRDTDQLLHKSYSVATPSTPLDIYDGRDRYRSEADATTTIEVRTAHRLRPDAASEDYDAALNHEAAALVVILDNVVKTYIHVRPEGTTRRTVTPAGDWLISLMTFTVHHPLTLT